VTYLLRCTRCGRVEEENALRFRCECGGAFDIEFEPPSPPERTVDWPYGLSRWRDVLPLQEEAVSLGEGGNATPAGRYGWAESAGEAGATVPDRVIQGTGEPPS